MSNTELEQKLIDAFVDQQLLQAQLEQMQAQITHRKGVVDGLKMALGIEGDLAEGIDNFESRAQVTMQGRITPATPTTDRQEQHDEPEAIDASSHPGAEPG